MIQYELIICFTDNTWTTEFVMVEPAHIDSDNDVHESYVENYEKNWQKGDKKITFVGTYHTEDIEDVDEEEIIWKPHPKEYPVAGLKSNEAYENVKMGMRCHSEVKEWIPVYKGENMIIIPYDGKN